MAKEIKKSLLVTLDFPPNLGGVATFYYNVCKNLPVDKIVVLAPKQKGAEVFDAKQNFTIIRENIMSTFPSKMPKSIGGILKIAASIRWMSIIKHISRISKDHGIELIQAGQILPIGTLALVYKKRKKIPYIFYAHGLDILLPQKFMRKKTILKEVVSNASAIVANSHFTKDELIKLGAKDEQVIVVHPCPNLVAEQVSEWKLEEIEKDHELKDKKIILTVGRLVERKGHDMVIKAMPQIIKEVPNVVYLIVGDGPQRKKLEQLVNKQSLRDYVHFLGAVDQTDLAAFYQLCNIFAMPARELNGGDVEGFGIVYLEANLFGKPVIGGRSGGVPEAVIDGQTGFLVDPIDIDEIAKKITDLLTDQSLAERLGMQGLARVSEEFDWQTQTNKIKEILKQDA